MNYPDNHLTTRQKIFIQELLLEVYNGLITESAAGSFIYIIYLKQKQRILRNLIDLQTELILEYTLGGFEIREVKMLPEKAASLQDN